VSPVELQLVLERRVPLAVRTRNSIVVTLFAFAACASTMEIERREYILSRPHGWIEVSIADDRIPMVPTSDEDPRTLVSPDSCSIAVRLDREPYASIEVFPSGDRPPFAVKSGVRFPAPLGPALMEVSYSGCDVADGKKSGTSAQLYVGVAESRVTDVAFDGSALTAGAPRDDSVVTLDDLYQAVTGRKKAAP
jgi:hypothetical protein